MTARPDRQRSLLLRLGVERLGVVAVAYPIASAIAIAVISIVALFGMQRLSVDDSLTELFRTNTDEFRQYEEVATRFPSSEYDVLVVVEGENLLDPKPLAALRDTVLELNFADAVQGVVSLFSARAMPDATGYAPPVIPAELPSGAAYDAMIADLRANQIVAGKLLSEDGTLALLVLALDRARAEEIGLANAIGGIRDTIRTGLADTGLSVQFTGAPVMQLEIRNAVQRDRLIYNGLGLVVGAFIAYLFFRRLSLTFIAAAGPALAILWAMGAIGFLDFRLNLFLNVIIPLITVNGFSDSMHLVFNIRRNMIAGMDRFAATRAAVLAVAPACFLTTLTSAIALGSFMFAKSALIHTFGFASTLAVIIAYVAIVTVVPVLAVLLLREETAPREVRERSDWRMALLADGSERLFAHVGRFAGLYVALSVATVGLCSWAYVSLEPHYRLADQVPDREEALKATGRLDQKLTGANPVHIMIKWRDGRSLYSEETLDIIASAHRIIEREPGVGNVWSIETLRRWLRQAGDPGIDTLKRYVDLLPEHLTRRFIAAEEDTVLITGRLPDVDASELVPVIDALDRALQPVRAANPDFEIAVTGLPAIAARNSAQMIWELNVGLSADIIVVVFFLAVAFRSVFVGVISFLPGLFPIVATGALLYVTGDGLHFASIIALTVAFGLALDSNIHFLNRLDLEEVDETGAPRSIEETLRHTARMIGPVIILTTIVLALGLGVTMLSELPSLRVFGQLSAITLFAALMAQIIILPACIAFLRRWTGHRGRPVLAASASDDARPAA